MLFVSLDFSVRNNVQNSWAVLLAAAATIVAGVGGGILAWQSAQRQVENQNRLASEEVERSLMAARAVLPPVLSSLYLKSVAGFEASDDQLSRSQDESASLRLLSELELSEEELKALTGCIKFADPGTARWLSLIISHFQIGQARLRSHLLRSDLTVDAPSSNDQAIAYRAIDWLEIKALVSHLFEFARTGTPPGAELDTSKISPPIEYLHTGPTARCWKETFDDLMRHYDENSGVTSEAFQKRLIVKL